MLFWAMTMLARRMLTLAPGDFRGHLQMAMCVYFCLYSIIYLLSNLFLVSTVAYVIFNAYRGCFPVP